MGNLVRLTVKERILLHLLPFGESKRDLEVPRAVAQEGIAEACWVSERHLTQYLRPLTAGGLVNERRAHVRGVRQRRKVYFLTESGERAAGRLRDAVMAATVLVDDSGGIRELTVGKVIAEARGAATPLAILRLAGRGEPIRIDDVSLLSGRFRVEMLAEAPRIEEFVGRAKELEAITAESGGPRLFVIRGVAGIGKSSLGARACELLRGKQNLFWHRIRSWDSIDSMLARLGDFLATVGKPGLRAVLMRGQSEHAAEVLREDLPGTDATLVFDDAHELGAESITFLRILKEALGNAQDVRVLVLTRRALSFYDRRDVALAGLVDEIDLQGLPPEDAAMLVQSEPGESKFVELGHRLGGHPLFLKLVRAQHAAPTAMRDVHRFIKEEIYEKLTRDERTVMKTASLYRVPVPPKALLNSAGLSHDVIFSLADQSLILPVGEDRFEVHDTIRDFFWALLTKSEGQTIGAFAARELSQLALEAQENANFVVSVSCLSNAVQLLSDAKARSVALELLGDANIRIGDMPGAFAAFREVLNLNPEGIIAARIHRKIATVLVDRGEIAAASREIADARGALGDTMDVEHGWLDLLDCAIAIQRDDWEEARKQGEAAIDIFRTFHEPLGLAETLLRFELIETHSSDANPKLAERYLEEALNVSSSIANPEFAAKLHLTLFHFFAYHRRGDIERSAAHLSALLNAPQIRGDLAILPFLLVAQGFFELDFRGETSLAAARFSESMTEARRIHDVLAIAESRSGLALTSFYLGMIDEARRSFEQCVAEMRGLGLFHGSARTPGRLSDVWSLWMIAECCLMQGDFEGFNRVAASLEEPEYRRRWGDFPVLAKVLRGVDLYLNVGPQEALKVLRQAVQVAEKGFAVQGSPFVNAPHLAHLIYGLVLRVTGGRQEAVEQIRRAREILQACNLKGPVSFLPEEERRLSEALRKAGQPS